MTDSVVKMKYQGQCQNMESHFLPDRDAMLGLRVPDATNAVKEEGGGQRGTEHMARPDDGSFNGLAWPEVQAEHGGCDDKDNVGFN